MRGDGRRRCGIKNFSDRRNHSIFKILLALLKC